MRVATFLLALLTVVGIPNLQAGQLGVSPSQLNQAIPAMANPFVGTWTSESPKRASLPRLGLATLGFAVDADTLTISRFFMSDSGRGNGGTRAYQVDGEEHPWGPEATYVAKWVGSRVLTIALKSDGQELGQRTYVVSRSPHILTVTDLRKDTNGADDVSQIVLYRQQPPPLWR